MEFYNNKIHAHKNKQTNRKRQVNKIQQAAKEKEI
jgi:hypothetical protein